jgi:hypothetical protein
MFRDASVKIERYLGEAPRERPTGADRFGDRMDRGDRGDRFDRGMHGGGGGGGGGGDGSGVRYPLEALRDEARRISTDAPAMDPAALRLHIEAVTAETRALQNRAVDPEDQDIAAKILRALTAIVSEHRPGHVYGLARHHQADWDEVARRARREISDQRAPHGDGLDDSDHAQ